MAKGDDKRVRQAIDAETVRSNTQNQQLFNQFNQQYQDARAQDNALRTGVQDNLLNFKPSYDVDKYLSDAGFGGGVSSGGAGGSAMSIARGIDPSLIRVVGGIDVGRINSMGADPYAGYKEMSKGLGDQFWKDYRNWENPLKQAVTGYQDFATTGGFNQGDLDAIRAQALAPTRAIYQQGQDQLARMQNLGANVGSGGAALSRIMREQNQAISDAAVSNEANMAKLIREGKLAGLAGLESTAATGMSARTQVEALDQQMRAQGLGGMTDIEKARLTAELENRQIQQNAETAMLQARLENQGLIQRGDIAAAQLAESAASRAASASAASRAQALREAELRAEMDKLANEQYLKAQGMGTDLLGTTPASTQLADEALLKLYQEGNRANLGLIDSRISGAQLPGTFQSAMGNVGSVLNLGGSIARGFGGL